MKLPRPAMIVASLALVASVSTGGYAATNLITGKQVAKETLTA
ncbi:MAG: hypothetical protein QOD86_624, partial [Miltoncostaeaceae bacterium]|nr:hypothetical protein [Miltoncostaeaceae bacterium]